MTKKLEVKRKSLRGPHVTKMKIAPFWGRPREFGLGEYTLYDKYGDVSHVLTQRDVEVVSHKRGRKPWPYVTIERQRVSFGGQFALEVDRDNVDKMVIAYWERGRNHVWFVDRVHLHDLTDKDFITGARDVSIEREKFAKRNSTRKYTRGEE